MLRKTTPRGIRNNNPLNIRIGNTWLGEVAKPTDSDFEQFVSMEYGIRAAFIILRRYIRRYGKNTISSIISTWAPATENDTCRYIDFVSHEVGLKPDDIIHFSDKETMCKLVGAMTRMECGQSIPDKVIFKGYDLA